MTELNLYDLILGLPSPWKVTSVDVQSLNHLVLVKVGRDGFPGNCPECGKTCNTHDHQVRRWRHLDSVNLQTIIEARVPRVDCPTHGVAQIKIPWAEPRSHFTALFEGLILCWGRHASFEAVRKMTKISWDHVDGIVSRGVQRGLQRRNNESIVNLGLDETSFQKRHEYTTILTDKDRRIVIDVLNDRKEETLTSWFRQNKSHLESLNTISMDMWRPYLAGIRKVFKNADDLICFDRFHVAQYFSKAIDKVRSEEHKQRMKNGDACLKNTRYNWLRNPENIHSDIKSAFMTLAKSALKTSRMWAMKEAAREIWDYVSLGWAKKMWLKLLRWMERSKLLPAIKLAKMLRRNLVGILNAIKKKSTNALPESLNSKIQKIKRIACGFRNRERFRSAILFHLGGLNVMPRGAEDYFLSHT